MWWVIRTGKSTRWGAVHYDVVGAPNCKVCPDPARKVSGPFSSYGEARDAADEAHHAARMTAACAWVVVIAVFVYALSVAVDAVTDRAASKTVVEPLSVPDCTGCTKGGKVEYEAQGGSERAIFAYIGGWYCNEVEGVCLD